MPAYFSWCPHFNLFTELQHVVSWRILQPHFLVCFMQQDLTTCGATWRKPCKTMYFIPWAVHSGGERNCWIWDEACSSFLRVTFKFGSLFWLQNACCLPWRGDDFTCQVDLLWTPTSDSISSVSVFSSTSGSVNRYWAFSSMIQSMNWLNSASSWTPSSPVMSPCLHSTERST